MTDPADNGNRNSQAAKLAERLLSGAVESLARAGAKFVESVAADVKRALAKESQKAELFEHVVRAWRQTRLGEVDDDLPTELKSNGKEHEGT